MHRVPGTRPSLGLPITSCPTPSGRRIPLSRDNIVVNGHLSTVTKDALANLAYFTDNTIQLSPANLADLKTLKDFVSSLLSTPYKAVKEEICYYLMLPNASGDNVLSWAKKAEPIGNHTSPNFTQIFLIADYAAQYIPPQSTLKKKLFEKQSCQH